MTVNHMPEEVIKKALECCSKEGNRCKKCPNNALLTCRERTMEEAIDLINRKNAENYRLNFENLQMLASIKGLEERVRAEAIKEFAERMKELITEIEFVEDWDIDQIAKEMGVEL